MDEIEWKPEIGNKVELIGSHEVGVVVSVWWDKKLETWDCYVAFVGTKWPGIQEQPDKPYVLRYLNSSLVKILTP